MTYERYKTGMFRVFVFLTVVWEVLAFFGNNGSHSYILGMRWGNQEAILFAPFIIWSIYFFSLWIIKGFLSKK